MRNKNLAIAVLSAMLIYGTSSCTSKSENASTQLQETILNCNETKIKESENPLEALKQGNERFYSGKLIHNHQDIKRIKELEVAQHPKAVIISCSDSRVPPEIVFDQGLGDLFTIRTAGNVMDDYEEGSVEYAAEHLNTKLIVVMGHEGCGAIAAMINHKHDDEHNHIPNHITSIITALENEEEAEEALKNTENKSSAMVRANVVHGVKQLRNSQPILAKLYNSNKIDIVGAVYHLKTGKVEFIDI